MLNITHYQRNANQKHNEVQLHASQDGCHPKLFLVYWSKPEMQWTFPLVLLLQCLIGFGLLYFYFHSFLCISWFPFWFLPWFDGYSEVCYLVSICLFFFFIFFLCNWDLVLLHCGQKRWLEWLQIVLNLSKLDLWPGWDLFWRSFCVHLRKRWNWMFWGEIFYRYQLCPAGSLSHLKFVFPC